MQIAISQTIKNECKDYFYITLGLLLYTFGWTIFLLPYQIVTGGVTGIAAVIYYGTGIPIYLSYFLINAALLLAALKILGFKFMVKTIYAIIMLSVFLALAQDWMIGEDGKMVQILGEGQDFMSLIIGCLFTGLSLAIVFLHNGSTGGTDIIAAIVNKYHNISLGRVLIFVDLLIVGSSFFVFNAKPEFTTIDAVRKVVFGLCTLCDECQARKCAVYDIQQEISGDSQCHRYADGSWRNHSRWPRLVHGQRDEGALYPSKEERERHHLPYRQDHRPKCLCKSEFRNRCVWRGI